MVKKFTKVLSVLLIFVMLAGTFSLVASAAKTTAYDFLNTSMYAKCYTLNKTGKTIPYTNSNLSTRGTRTYGASKSSYIDNACDELYLCDVGVNSKGVAWAYVSYPTSSGRVYAYIPLSVITGNNGSHVKKISSGKFNCSYRRGVSASSSYYVAKGDAVYLLHSDSNGKQILYPISGGKWRIGWASSSNYNKYCANKSTPAPVNTSKVKTQFPVKSYTVSQKYGNYYSPKGMYHAGIDVYSSNRNIYAFADGTVVYRGGKSSDGNGYRVVLSHNINGKTVYSSYSHLSSYKECPAVGSKVSVGKVIGIMGTTGNSTGVHLHFAIYDKKSTDPYGYTSGKPVNNKSTRNGFTFYDPLYVVNNGKLPA